MAALLVLTCLGAWQLAFLCDDAFITYRYVANAREGHGLVWNPPPFEPVEGYTGFAWALLLWATWSLTGVPPPAAANWLSLLCGIAQFAIVAAAALRLRDRNGAPLPAFAGLATLAVIVGNRTFLQWMTSGLETALYNTAFVAWVLLAFRRQRSSTGWLAAWSAAAAVAALTRPDGLLLVAATAGAAALALARRQLGAGTLWRGLLPLTTVLAHVLWRRWFYGEWLPNTYYAKVVAAWPEAGARYLGCFLVENGTWLAPLVAVAWLAVAIARDRRFLVRTVLEQPAATAAVAATLLHAAYYVVQIGGDHFEYRVFSHLVPLCVLAVAAMTAQLARGARLPLLAVLVMGITSGVSWVHCALTRDMPLHGFVRITPQLPAWAQPFGRWFDRQQAWLLFHNIGLRCNHHARLLEEFRKPYPGRLRIVDPPDAFPVSTTGAVGIVGWSLPDCAIIDSHGLNDWVVARTPAHGFAPPLTRERLRPLIEAADADGDGWLDAAELRGVLALITGRGTGVASPDAERAAGYLIAIMTAIHCGERDDALTRAEAESIGDLLQHARSMAHERHPPPGYIDAWQPNVAVANGVATAAPRRVPLTAERVRAIEQEWREKTRRGELLR